MDSNAKHTESSVDSPSRRTVIASCLGALATLSSASALAGSSSANDAATTATAAGLMTQVAYRRQVVGEVELFYREAGPKDAPVLLLLHGFPTSSHMFRDLIPKLADRYRLIAPDLPGFGNTNAPARGKFNYTFVDILPALKDGDSYG